jgi:hypothetical protein
MNIVSRIEPRTWQDTYDNFMINQMPYTKKIFEKLYYSEEVNSRELIVGDNPDDINDKKYGINNLLTTSSNGGTVFAGIIAGSNAETNFEGIIPQAKIMTLVVSTHKGEPLIKDMALSIRYAVDNGADIIVLPQQGSFYSPISKEWIHSAIKYADKKGVLVIIPVSEYSTDMSRYSYYPSSNMFPGSILNNLMTVGCSDQQGLPSISTNYGKEELDVFAPGKSIYSTLPGDLYAVGNSSSLGAIVTAGAAAFIKAYFPKIKGDELKDLLVRNVTDLKDKEVEINVNTKTGMRNELFLYGQLCRAGGIINLKNSISSILNKK